MTSHLWESTLFAAVAALLALVLRKNAARVRHWLWLIASMKFLIPFSLLVGVGSHFGYGKVPAAMAPQFSYVMGNVQEQLRAPEVHVAASSAIAWPIVGAVIWAGGCAVVLLAWCIRWWRVRSVVRAALAVRMANVSIPVMSSPALLEPGVFGIWRPVLLLPQGITERLTAEQLDAIVAHELCHVRRHDNLAAVMHMVVEALFWFHPLVWWIGARLVEERERACDEEVLRMGKEPEVYAESILKVCRFYVESPIKCVSGVTGADLKKRIEEIMTLRAARALGFGRKLLLAAVGVVAVAGPLVVGIMNAPSIRAQSAGGPAPKFEVAAIRPAEQDNEHQSSTDDGRFLAHNLSLKRLIARAYDIDGSLISGGPKWVDSDTYDINAKIPEEFAQQTHDKMPLMLQSLLADRFKLVIHRELEQISGYALVVTKDGPKMDHANPDEKGIKIRSKNAHLVAESVTMDAFAKDLSRNRDVGKLVVDKTGLSDRFKFELDWSSEPSDDHPSIFTALQERLGLKLESAKIPVSVIVIDHAEKPSAN